jgi:hypothetical protein
VVTLRAELFAVGKETTLPNNFAVDGRAVVRFIVSVV